MESFPSMKMVVESELMETSVPGSRESEEGSFSPSLHSWRQERTSGDSFLPRRIESPAKNPWKWYFILESLPSQQAPTTRVVLTPFTECSGQSSTISGLFAVSFNLDPSTKSVTSGKLTETAKWCHSFSQTSFSFHLHSAGLNVVCFDSSSNSRRRRRIRRQFRTNSE